MFIFVNFLLKLVQNLQKQKTIYLLMDNYVLNFSNFHSFYFSCLFFQIFETPPVGVRKIVMATNIAETRFEIFAVFSNT